MSLAMFYEATISSWLQESNYIFKKLVSTLYIIIWIIYIIYIILILHIDVAHPLKYGPVE